MRIVGRFVALPSYTAHGGFLCYSKGALYHFTTTRSVYFYGIMRKTAAKIYQRNASSVLDLAYDTRPRPSSTPIHPSRSLQGVLREFSADSWSTSRRTYITYSDINRRIKIHLRWIVVHAVAPRVLPRYAVSSSLSEYLVCLPKETYKSRNF